MSKEEIRTMLKTISSTLFNVTFQVNLREDKLYVNHNGEGRLYIQVAYFSSCNKTGKLQMWYGRKWYLSEYMTPDEVMKTAYTAYKTAVEHEIMETFKVDGVPLFNPHTNHKRLLEVSLDEIKREEK